MGETELNKPTAALDYYYKGEKLSASKFNQTVDTLNRLTNGAGLPKQILDRKALPPVLFVRVVVTATTQDMGGEVEVDGKDVYEGDWALVTVDDDQDGIYEVARPWKRLWRISPDHGNDDVPVLPRGQLISVYDGDSAPALYMVALADVEEV